MNATNPAYEGNGRGDLELQGEGSHNRIAWQSRMRKTSRVKQGLRRVESSLTPGRGWGTGQVIVVEGPADGWLEHAPRGIRGGALDRWFLKFRRHNNTAVY